MTLSVKDLLPFNTYLFSNHQKTVYLHEKKNEKRAKIKVFIGGIKIGNSAFAFVGKNKCT